MADVDITGLTPTAPADAPNTGRVGVGTAGGWQAVLLTKFFEAVVRLSDAPAATALLAGSGHGDQSFTFTADGFFVYVAPAAVTFAASPIERGTGTLAYEKALANAPNTFTTTTLPVGLAAGDQLKVTASGVSGYKASTLVRSA